MSHSRRIALVASLACLVLSFSASPKASADDEWSYQLIPLYLWAQSTDGTAMVGNETIPVVLDFSDAVNALDGGFTFHFEGWRGDWGLILDYARIRLADETIGPVFIRDLHLDENIMEGALGWKFGSRDLALLAGVRYYDLEFRVRTEGILQPPRSTTVGPSFTDFFAGIAWRPQFGRWSFHLRADAGTGDSDLVLNSAALLGFQMTDLLEIFAGYKILDYDLDEGRGDDRFAWDVRKDGFAAGLAFNF